MADFSHFPKLARLVQCLWHGQEWFLPELIEGEFEMQNTVSLGSRVAAFFSAMAITGLMLTAYFAPPASAAVGIVA